MTTTYSNPYLPSEPLIGFIRSWCAMHPPLGDHERGGLGLLADRYMAHHGERADSVNRRLNRILSGETARVTLDFADKLCLSGGSHPAMVYGSLWNVEESVA